MYFYRMGGRGEKMDWVDKKQFYITLSTICTFMAMYFVYSGEISPSWLVGAGNAWRERYWFSAVT